ncbi:ribosomal RNA small subunit methyltransferase G [Armatimonadota bacterium]|nr:ribosomal RNA small subunit methyltransferase G [Armatimonadota bacterium]
MPFSETQQNQLKLGAKEWGLDLHPLAIEQFTLYANRLEEVNKTFNLTRVRPEEYHTLHFLDSLSLFAVLQPAPGQKLLDVGTGAGLPGLALAIAFPSLKVTLMDATLKRLRFLDAVIEELGLSNAATLHARAEQKVGGAQFDIVTARAVARLPQLVDLLLPFVNRGGAVIAYKTPTVDEEIAETRPLLPRYRATLERVAKVTLPETDIVRRLVLVRRAR